MQIHGWRGRRSDGVKEWVGEGVRKGRSEHASWLATILPVSDPSVSPPAAMINAAPQARISA
jgi:hypothetical protein